MALPAAGDLGPRHPGRASTWPWRPAWRRHPHSRRAARGHLGRPRAGALRHPQRHLQLHPHRDRAARRRWRPVLIAEAQRLGYAEADPSATSMASTRAPSWPALRAGLRREDHAVGHFRGGHPPHRPLDFQYAHQLKHTIRLICGGAQDARRVDPVGAPGADSHLHHSGRRAGSYNAIWVKGIRRRTRSTTAAARDTPPASPW
jgi:hypothetical protein